MDPSDLPATAPGGLAPETETGSKRESENEDSEDEEEELEDEELVEELAADAAGTLSADSSYEYEKWRKPEEEGDEEEAGAPAADEDAERDTDEWKLSTSVFPVSAADKAVDDEAPEIVEKARRRREERRAARERRRRSLEDSPAAPE